MTFRHRPQERTHGRRARHNSQKRGYTDARSDWARHYAANATLQLHIR